MKRIKQIEEFILFVMLVVVVYIYTCPLTLSQVVSENKSTTSNEVTFDQTIGINGFVDDPLEVLKVAGTVREYHNYRWITEKYGETRYTQSTWWDFDDYYKKLHDNGITVLPCIQGTSQADRTNYNPNKQQKPINSDEDSTNPLSYSEHASTMYQYAARYGSTMVDESTLLLEPGQKAVSGLGYIKYYENWNEPDKTWEGEESNFSTEEFAAMLSADYDGHEGKLGNTYGIKNADPTSKLVMGGVASSGNYINYLNGIKAWSLANREDKSLPFDVLNFHMYTGKNSPENSEFISRIDEIVAWKNTNASGKEVWLTEFGWDTNINSAHGVTLANQRNFLMRTYLIANAHGIDRSTMYMSRDVGNSSDSGKYSTSGLTTKKDEWNKKSSWYGVYTLKNALTGFTFKEIIKEDSDVYIYKFINKTTKEECYVLWSPTEDGKTLDNYLLNIGDMQKATVTTFVDSSTIGSTTNLDINDKTISVNVTETPIFVKLSEPKLPIDYSIKLQTKNKSYKRNDTIEVTASLDKFTLNNNNGIKTIVANLEYDKKVFTIDEDSLDFTRWIIDNNKINFTNYYADTINSKKDLFTFKLKVNKDAIYGNSTIKLTSISAWENEDIYYTDDVVLNINISDNKLEVSNTNVDTTINVSETKPNETLTINNTYTNSTIADASIPVLPYEPIEINEDEIKDFEVETPFKSETTKTTVDKANKNSTKKNIICISLIIILIISLVILILKKD